MTAAQQLETWITKGQKLRVIPVGTQASLFGSEDRMVCVICGKTSITISQSELDLAISRVNDARAKAGTGEAIFGIDGNFAFEDAKPITLNGPGRES
jgi:hypothetical protein